MAPIDGAALADLYREADPGTVAAFVEDLYAARGYDVERPDEGLLRLQPGGRTLAVLPAEATEYPDAVDAVVTAQAGTISDPELDVVDAEALADQLAYALDRSVARDLLERHFGVEVGHGGADGQDSPVAPGATDDGVRDAPTPDQSAGDSSGDERDEHGGTPVDPRSWRRSRLTAVVAAAGVVLLVGVLAGGMPALSSGVGATDDATSAETPSPTPAETPTPSGDGNGAAIASGERTPERTPQHSIDEAYSQLTDQHPPGVDEDGLADIDTLIATHRSVLANSSFTVTVRYREFEDGRVTGTVVETVRVEDRDRFSLAASKTGTLETSPRVLLGVDAFSTENRTLVRRESREAYARSRLSTSRMLGQLARYLRWSLSVEESTLRGRPSNAGGTYRITTGDDPYQGIRDASGTIYVTGEGVITYGRWTYTNVRPETRVEFSVRTTGLGTTTVSRPGWVEENATG